MATKGSNDLNMLLKAQVVKVRVELDIPNSMPKIKKQVGEITEKLEKANKRVKIKVELDATIKSLQKQFSELQTKIATAKTVKPIKLEVNIDVAGSAKQIKNQLKDVYKTVEDFNRQYAQQIKKMQTQMNSVGNGVPKNVKNNAIPQDSSMFGFDYKLYSSQVKQAEKMMRDSFGKKGLFGSIETRDAQGQLTGFIASLEKANGVVQKIRYEWNAQASSFLPINQTTVDSMQKHIHKAEQSLKGLQAEMFKLQDGSGKSNLWKQFQDLEKRASHNTLTNDAVKDLQRQIKEEQVLQKQIEQTNKDYIERQKLLREIRNAQKGALRKDPNTDVKPFIELQKSVKEETKSVAEQRLEYQKLNDTFQRRFKDEKELMANTKQRMQLLHQLKNIERSTPSSDRTSQDLIREIRFMAERAQYGKEWNVIQSRMNMLQTSNSNANEMQKITTLQDKLNRKMVEYGQLTNRTDGEIQQLKNNVSVMATKGSADLTVMYNHWKRKIQEIKDEHKNMANNSKVLISGSEGNMNGVNINQLRSAINQGDVNSVQQYVEKLYGARVEVVKVKDAKDSLGRAVDRLDVKMAGHGKTIRTYTLDLDRANNVLRQTEAGTDYNANRNLGIIEQLKVAMARVPVWMTAMTAFYGTINGFRAMAEEILKVDKSLTELRRVASDSINLEHVFEGAVKLAGDLGNNVHDVMNTMNEFARTFGDFNERQLLAITRTATLMSNVSDLTTQEAGDSLVGTMNAFNIEAEESIRIVDAFNEVDNNFAVSTKQIAEGMSKTASTAKTFNVGMEESIGHITAIASVTMESGKVIGNSLKTIYSRITTMDGAQDVLEDVGVALYNVKGEVLPVDSILSDLAGKWGTLSDSQRQNIAVTVAGRYQLSRFLALMNNWDTAVEATETAILSQGSAMRENNEYMKSFESRLNSLKTGFTELALAVGDAVLTDSMMLIIEGLRDMAETATNVVSKVGLLPIAFAGIFAMLNTFGVFGKVKDMISGAVAQLAIFRGAMNTATAGGAGRLAGMTAGWNALTVAEARASTGATTFGFSLKSALISTGIGALVVVLGIAIEKFVGHLAEQKRVAEETEKANKTLVDSYRNTEGGLDALIKKHEQLQNKVDNDVIEQGTEAYNEYLKVNQQLAESMPTMVKYVDSNGKAHLETSEAMTLEYKIAQKLSKEYAKMDEIEFEKDVQERIKNIRDLGKEIEKLAEKRKKLDKENGQTKYVYDGAGYGVQTYEADNTKEIQQTKIESVRAYQEIQREVQAINLEVKETILSSLEADKAMQGMSETQIGTIESFVTRNEGYLMELGTMLKEGKITGEQFEKMMAERSNDLYVAGEKLGKILTEKSNKLVDQAVAQIPMELENYADEVEKVTGEVKNDFDMLLKSLPKTFFTEEMITDTAKFETALNDVMGIASQIQGGAFDFNSLTQQLQDQGLSLEQAQGMVIKLGYEYDNASIKAEAMRMKEEGLTEGLEGYIDMALQAVDATEQLFGWKDDELSALSSNIDMLQQLKHVYGENAEQTDQWKTAIENVSWQLGKEEQYVKDNLGYLYQVAELLPKLTLQRDEYGNAIGYNTEGLTEQEKAIIREIEANGQQGMIYDALTKQVTDNTGAKIENTTATEQNAVTLEREKQLIEEATAKFDTHKQALDDASRSTYLDTVDGQLDEYVGKLSYVKQEDGTFKLAMADGTESQYLNTLHTQLGDMGLKIAEVTEENGNLKLTLQDENGKSHTLDIVKDQAMTTKDEISGATKELGIFNETPFTPPNLSTWNLSPLVEDLETIQGKIVGLDGELRTTIESVFDAKTEIGGVVDGLSNIATTMDTILNNVPSLKPLEDKILDILQMLTGVQTGLGSLFKNISTELSSVNQPLDNLKVKIEDVGRTFAGFGGLSTHGIIQELLNLDGQLSITKTNVGLLGQTMSGLAGLTTGGLGEYVVLLGQLSGSLVLSAQYGQLAVNSQRTLAQSFATVVSVVKAYDLAISQAGAGVGVTYRQMAQTIITMTQIIIDAYNRNALGVTNMRSVIAQSLQSLVSDFGKKGTLMIQVMDTVTNAMHKEFKSGMDEIVATASGVPARIGKAIKDNMASASSSMSAVAKDMVKRFKEELGIHSPSRVFEDLGGWVIKGLANGLTGADLKSLGTSVFDDFGGGVFDSLDMIKAYVSGDFSSIAGQAGSGVQRWAGLATKALMMEGQYSPENLQRLLMQMQTESGGNPMAINLWDSNAKKGIPSMGLLQTVMPTYQRYKHPLFDKGPYDPMSNILASIRYAMARYGSLSRAYRGVGYAKGGIIDKEHLAMVGEEDKREVVIPLEQHRARAISLWKQAGEELGFNGIVDMFKNKRGRGGAGATQGTFGASSGEGGSESGSGGTGTSGVMQESKYVGGIDADGNYQFNALEMADLQSVNWNERELTVYGGIVSTIESRMNRMVKTSLEYRNSLKEIIYWENKSLENNRKELANAEARKKEVDNRLNQLSKTSAHTEAQREEYNKLLQEHESLIQKIASNSAEIENITNKIREKSIEIFTNLIDEMVEKYDQAIATLKDKTDDIQFKIDVLALTNEDDLETQLNLLAEKARTLQEEEQTTGNKRQDLEGKYNEAVSRYGVSSDQAKAVKTALDEAEEAWEDAVLASLQAEKEISDVRGSIADKGVDSLKDYYGKMKDMSTKAIESEKKELEEAHNAKMEMYDEEIEKINSVYDNKLKQMDKEKADADYQENLDEKTLKRTELVNKISLLSRDTTLEGRRKVAELKQELETVNEEIADMQAEHADKLLREQLKAQQEAQIASIEATKTDETTAYDNSVALLDAESEAISKRYDDMLNSEQYWANMRNEFIAGSFGNLTSELNAMSENLNQMSQGNFDNITSGFAKLSEEAKKTYAEMNALGVANMVYTNGDVIAQADAVERAKYEAYMGSGTNYDWSAETTWGNSSSNTSPNVPPAPNATPPSQRYHTVKRGDTLWDLAQAYYGNPYKWTTIANANQNPDPRKLTIGRNLLIPFKTGGYTGDWTGDEGKMAILHKKELVLTKEQTSDILNTAKLMDKLKGIIPSIQRSNIVSKLAGAMNVSTSISYGDIHVVVENGDRKKATDIASEILNGLKKKGR